MKIVVKVHDVDVDPAYSPFGFVLLTPVYSTIGSNRYHNIDLERKYNKSQAHFFKSSKARNDFFILWRDLEAPWLLKYNTVTRKFSTVDINSIKSLMAIKQRKFVMAPVVH